jgi:MFS family permease
VTARSRFVLLTALRWLPTGLVIPVSVLLPLQRGLSLGQVSTALAAQGVVVLALELPTGSLTDVAGRRLVFAGSALVGALGYLAVSVATTFTGFALAAALMGVFRALDSGPLEAWYVDHERATGRAQHVPRGLGAAGAALGGAIALGALGGGALVQWSGGGAAGLALPFRVAAVLAVVQGLVGAVLLDEPHRGAGRDRPDGAPRPPRLAGWYAGMGAGLRLAGRGGPLRWFVVAEAAAAVAMASFELLTPVRLTSLLGSSTAAAAGMGPISAAAWGVAAAGSALTTVVLRRSRPRTVATGLLLVQAGAVAGLALAGTAPALIAAYLLTYVVHLGYGATFGALVHPQVDDAHRATALSVLSMAGQGAGAVGEVLLGLVAQATSPSAGLGLGALALLAATGALRRATSRTLPTRAPRSAISQTSTSRDSGPAHSMDP